MEELLRVLPEAFRYLRTCHFNRTRRLISDALIRIENPTSLRLIASEWIFKEYSVEALSMVPARIEELTGEPETEVLLLPGYAIVDFRSSPERRVSVAIPRNLAVVTPRYPCGLQHDHTLMMLEDQIPTAACQFCLDNGLTCVKYSWARGCRPCERRLIKDCYLYKISEWKSYYDLRGPTTLNLERPFGRDLFKVELLQPFVEAAFAHMLHRFFNRTRLQYVHRISLIFDEEELRFRLCDMIDNLYSTTATNIVRNRLQEITGKNEFANTVFFDYVPQLTVV
ncbi:hypothetical protein B0H16DRAFT_1899468 [Mycena metata]|uniref:Uncharacterized protein n=1 Tax=Mycena metata TaxID=1033252 RepID=A0AAD7MEF2_9AGAR|nr:hypothetical protein B0H16DRAFT_1899468 [Mycena metata]